MKLLINETGRNDRLLFSISNFLLNKKLKMDDIDSILVDNSGEGFTTVRNRVVIANALGYALNIPISCTVEKARKKRNIQVIEPIYNALPNITLSKKV